MSNSYEITVEVTRQYRALFAVLFDAQKRAQWGKGRKRHGAGRPFQEQPIVSLCRLYGSGFAMGQVAKKMQEAQEMDNSEQARSELLDAIVYLAGAALYLDQEAEKQAVEEARNPQQPDVSGPRYPGMVDSEVEPE